MHPASVDGAAESAVSGQFKFCNNPFDALAALNEEGEWFEIRTQPGEPIKFNGPGADA